MTNGTSQGLFIIVAVVIFGIFIAMSYMLFRDNLSISLASIFEDSITKTQDQLTENITAERETATHLYAKIRDANEEKGWEEIWVKFEKLPDGNVKILNSSKEDVEITYATGGVEHIGEITIPKTINNMPVTEIGASAFSDSFFTGSFNAPSVTKIEQASFWYSEFTGDFNAPNVKNIELESFFSSKFKGTFNAQNVEMIGDSAFIHSNFTGSFNAPKVKTIENSAFQNSLFNGTFNAQNVENIGDASFVLSNFKGSFIAPKVKDIQASAFEKSLFTGDFLAPELVSIGQFAFNDSPFAGIKQTPKLTAEKIGLNAFKNAKFK